MAIMNLLGIRMDDLIEWPIRRSLADISLVLYYIMIVLMALSPFLKNSIFMVPESGKIGHYELTEKEIGYILHS